VGNLSRDKSDFDVMEHVIGGFHADALRERASAKNNAPDRQGRARSTSASGPKKAKRLRRARH
jgi:hypothetical protein